MRNEEKRRINIQKHGFDFADVTESFSHPILVAPDTRHDYAENRWRGLGWIRGRLTQVVFTERERDVVRIISLRKATRHERKEFEEAIHDGLETN